MADYQDAVHFVKAWEGGISGHTSDNASNTPSPCGNDPRYDAPIHTNKGVTWATYSSSVSSPNCDEFLLMPEAVWLYIWKNKYFDAVGGGTIKNQAIANTYASWAWGSGVTGANNLMQSVLMNSYGYSLAEVSSKYNRILILNVLSQKNIQQLFTTLMDARENYFRGLSDFSVFGNGWLNRLSDFKRYNAKYVSKDKSLDKNVLIAVFLLICLLILLYFVTQ